MKLIIDISEDTYARLFDNGIQDNEIAVDDVCEMARALRLGTPLDDVKAEIERLKHQYTDVSGYRWWNNAIDNCLHTIRDVCDAESEK